MERQSQVHSVPLTYVDSYIYTCDFCGKTPESRSQLEVHLDEDHDLDASEIAVDEPPFRLRKLDLYRIKVSLLLYFCPSGVRSLPLGCTAGRNIGPSGLRALSQN